MNNYLITKKNKNLLMLQILAMLDRNYRMSHRVFQQVKIILRLIKTFT